MAGGYRFTKVKAGALRVVPDKNDKEGFSHVADCLQYACLVVHGGLTQYIVQRLAPPPPPSPVVHPGGWT